MFLLAASAAAGAAAPAASDGSTERSAASASPTSFAERAVAGGQTGREAGSWHDAIELIVLAGTCAIAVAFYSAATAQRPDTRVPVRIRRR